MQRFLTGVLLAVFFAACGGDDSPGRSCTTDSECASSERCVDSTCIARPDASADTGTDTRGDALMCADERPACGFGTALTCCDTAEVCMDGRCVADCGGRVLCDGVCCDEGAVCEADACVADCSDITLRCGTDGSICCGAEELCLSDECVTPGDECTQTDDCAPEEICLPSLDPGRCVPRESVEVCEFRPPVGEFSPVVACQWLPGEDDFPSFASVTMTPAVANMTDDNGDGLTNTDDIPDIVFISHDRADGSGSARGLVRIISGLCNEDRTMTPHATIDMPFVGNSAGIALGNLNPAAREDLRNPEIVAVIKFPAGIPAAERFSEAIAFRRTADDGSAWEEMWRTDGLLPQARASAGAQPSIVDVNGDGRPEVLVGNIVLNGQNGRVIWDGEVTVGAEAGIGNGVFGPVSTAADIDVDGDLEVIAGNTVYDAVTGEEVWTFELPEPAESVCSSRCDGFPAVGNFDDDDEAEIVLVYAGEVYILEHDGTLKHRILMPFDDCRTGAGDPRNESGPPTVADFDGDGRPEVGSAGADFYYVADPDCIGTPLPDGCANQGILWQVPNNDCSSRSTASSVFDFEGDGRAEVVYADERNFRIFDGQTGRVLFDDETHSSNTRMEMPIVVDVDNDGKSEIIVPEPNAGLTVGRGGIEVWEDSDNNWVRTRRIWNQFSYHVTNITEDGQVPAVPDVNWLNPRLNNFRQNVQPGGLFDAPDLVVVDIDFESCDPTGSMDVGVTVGNRGALGVAAGVPIQVVATSDDAIQATGSGLTTRFLLPGQEERVVITIMSDGTWSVPMVDVSATVDDDGMGGALYNECNEDNNTGMTSEAFRTCNLG